MPTMAQLPALYPDAFIGELRVEILEAEGLTGDTVTEADAYALLVFEGCTATTNTIWNSNDPAWGSNRDYRAFVFPIVHPHSCLCLALMESDTHESAGVARYVDLDDVLGRVVVHLGGLYAHTVYDCAPPPRRAPTPRRLLTHVAVRAPCRATRLVPAHRRPRRPRAAPALLDHI